MSSHPVAAAEGVVPTPPPSPHPTITIVRGRCVDIKHLVTDPEELNKITSPRYNEDGTPDYRQVPDIIRYIHDGIIISTDGIITYYGAYADAVEHDMIPHNVPIDHYPDKLILPGFFDTHIHFPQTEMIASFGEQLLSWLNTYTFPTEAQFKDLSYATNIADCFIKQLLKNGTTTALIFCTVHSESVDALYNVSQQYNMRIIAGKVLMDRNAPDNLLDTPQSGYDDSKALIDKYHNTGRFLYAITPRFAPTSTDAQLELAGKLKAEYPDVYVHTHLSENKGEIAWVSELFPKRSSYLDVYNHYGLTGPRSVFAHCVHLQDDDFKCLHETDSTIAFCPSSNLFLGSGLFPLHKTWEHQIRVGLGTDVGAGTSFSQFQTLGDGYKIQQLQGNKLNPYESLYHLTLGSAHSLHLDNKLGNFDIGKESDFVVVDLAPNALQQLRIKKSKRTLRDQLFSLFTLGDDRNISATYIAGKRVYVNTNFVTQYPTQIGEHYKGQYEKQMF